MSRLPIIAPDDVWSCSSCGGDLHCKWTCPACGKQNECYYLAEDKLEGDACEWPKCGARIVLSYELYRQNEEAEKA